MDKNTRLLLDCLYTAAWLEGQPEPEARSVLDRIMVRLGIPRDWIMQELGRFSQSRPNQVPRPGQIPEAARSDLMRDVLAVCLADGPLSEQEHQYVNALAGAWGLVERLDGLRQEAEDFVEKRQARQAPETASAERRDPLRIAEPKEHGRTVFRGEGFGKPLDLGED